MESIESIQLLDAILDLHHRPVGVRFLYTEQEYDALDVPACSEKLNYCQMVRLAGQGKGIKAKKEDFRCQSGARAFGLMDIPESVRSGEGLFKMGLYPDLMQQRMVYSRMAECMQKIAGLQVAPLEQYTDVPPHVVVLVTTPYNVMRFVQGYAYQYGGYRGGQCFGNRAICCEATAHPFVTQDLNITPLCSGTRYHCGWESEEMALGIPYEKWIPTVNGILQTLNATEPLENKKWIAARLERLGIDFAVDRKKSYYCTWN